MTPAARVQAAIGVLDQVFDGMPAEKALTHWARGARYAGSKDRAAVRDFVFQAIRCRDSYAVLGGGQTGRQVMIGQIRAEGGQPETYFTGSPYAPAPLTAAECAIAAKADPGLNTDLPPDLPAWLYGKFEESLGAEGAAEAAGMLRRRAPVMLRVNGRKADPVDVIASLATDGVSASAVPEIETALHVTDGARRVGQTRAYLSGDVELQDAHSQAAMVCLEVRDGARVLDYCAGGGGKTLALAARINATYFAHDANPRRMKDLPDRAHRAGVAVDLVQGEAVRRHGPYDLVLCDVPCSGSGTWRRSPEAKWSLTPDRLASLCRVQAEILDQAVALTAPGGCIAYTTCSVLREENEDRIAMFLSTHPDWSVHYARSWPLDARGDGFFLTTLTQRPSDVAS